MKSITPLACALALATTPGCQAASESAAAATAPAAASAAGAGVAPGHSHVLPRHALIGYLHNFDNGIGVLPLGEVDDSWDVIVLAFADERRPDRLQSGSGAGP